MASNFSPLPAELRCHGLLFDMDGILVSSMGSVERSWTKWAQMRGVDPVYACRVAHGVRAIETVSRLRPDLDPRQELALIEQIEIEDTEGVAALPGAVELLRSLPPARWTVVTSATPRLARARMEMAGITPPEKFISADDVAEGKPNPAPYLAGARLLGFAPEDCVVFEDSESGTKAGRAAGCIVVATTFSHPAERLSAAHFLIETLHQVSCTVESGGLVLNLTLKNPASRQPTAHS
jgi:sugar-phosphatase